MRAIENSTKSKKYRVFVDDNFHFNDENERYKLDEFDSCEKAISACKRIIDEFMEKAYKKGMNFSELYGGYINFGEDPFIQSDDEKCEFSAWTYAKKRSQELCQE
jgi:hypothetical protein